MRFTVLVHLRASGSLADRFPRVLKDEGFPPINRTGAHFGCARWSPLRGWDRPTCCCTRGNKAVDESRRKQILHAATSLGPITAAAGAARLLAALYAEPVDVRSVVGLINSEPAITIRVLRVANSAYYGLSWSVASVRRAVLVLGLDAVRAIAAAACLERALPATAASVHKARQLLLHSIATAAACQALAADTHPTRAADAFLSGLLHDIGVAVQLRLDAYDGFIQLAQPPTSSSADAGLKPALAGHDGRDHAEGGALIVSEWNLPIWLSWVVAAHGRPFDVPAPHRPLACLLALADQLAVQHGYGHGPDDHHAWNTEALASEALVPIACIDAVGRRLPDLTEHIYQALGST